MERGIGGLSSSEGGELSADDIYFGSMPAYFAVASGTTIPFVETEWSEDRSAEGLASVCARGARQSQPGHPGPPDVVVPAIPALDIVRSPASSSLASDASHLPELLRRPLVKVPRGSPDAVLRGRASGTRSGLVNLNGAWYRLKGCGNDEKGFTVRTSPHRSGPWRDIRGSAFPDTAARELAMAARVQRALEGAGVAGCNEAVGMMVYDAPEQLPLGPEFPTACIVEKTLGDRRLGTHVMAGLLLILPRLVDEDKIDLDKLLAAFPTKRPRREDGVSGVVPTSHLMTDLQISTGTLFVTGAPLTFSDALDCADGMFPGLRRDATLFADFSAPENARVLAEAEVAPKHPKMASQDDPPPPPGLPPAFPDRQTVQDDVAADTAAYPSSPPLPATPSREGHRHDHPRCAEHSSRPYVDLDSPGRGRCENCRGQVPGSKFEAAGAYCTPKLCNDCATVLSECGWCRVRIKLGREPDFPAQFTRKGIRAMTPPWQAVWSDNCRQLSEALAKRRESEGAASSNLAYLFSRLGYDAGRSMKGFHDKRLSWGTYTDAMCSEGQWHCNAHSNNVVLTAEGLLEKGQPGADSLLSVLDLDMAFDEHSFVDIDKKKVGLDPEEFSRLLVFEAVQLFEVLMGSSDSTNGVPQVAMKMMEEIEEREKLDALGSALRDTMALGFLSGYTGDSGAYPVVSFDENMHKVAHIICRLAISVMADYVA